LHVRQGVLDGIKGQRIIAGAHADASGGVCPMVAADAHVHWQSVSTSSVRSAQEAAGAWDRYAEATGTARKATKRQLLALTAMLEASILQEEAQTQPPLVDAIAEYERARSRQPGTEAPATGPEVTFARPNVSEPAAAPSMPAPVAVPGAPGIAERASVPDPAARPSLRKRRNTGERDRTSELSERGGWAWLRPFRSYDEYEETLLRALAELDAHERELHELQVR
jgi:hypothetical protein